MALLKYDPNYLYNDDGEDEEMASDGDEGWGSDDEWGNDEESQQDEDSSWKVRRGAIQVLEAVIKTRQDLVQQIAEEYGDVLVDRFKERVNDVKVCILELFQDILQSSVELAPITLDLEIKHASSLRRANSAAGVINNKTESIVRSLTK